MKNILEDLFEGELAGRKESFSDDPAYQEAIDWVVRTEDALRAALPAPKLSLAAAFADAQMELTCLTERRAFVTGVRLGVQLLRAMEEDPWAIAEPKNACG